MKSIVSISSIGRLSRVGRSFSAFSNSSILLSSETDASAVDAPVVPTKAAKPKREIRIVGDKRAIVQQQRKRNLELEAKAFEKGLGWRIVGASVLHRYPTILPEMPDWEKDFSDVTDYLDDMKRAVRIDCLVCVLM